MKKATYRTALCLIVGLILVLVLASCESVSQTGTQLPSAVSDNSPGLQSSGILFNSNRDGKTAWYLMQADGSNVRMLDFPNLEPGHKLSSLRYVSDLKAFVASLVGADGNDDLYLLDFDGNTLYRITNDPYSEGEFDYDPRTKRLVYVCAFNELDICLVNLDGTGFINLTQSMSREGEPKWYPSGDKILYSSDITGLRGIVSIKPDGTELTDISKSSSMDSNPSWSPDGKKILIQSQRDGYWDIFVLDADGSQPVNLSQTPEGEYSPLWSPDGTKILFRSLRNNGDDLYIMDADGTNVIQLTDSPKDMETVYQWVNDGEQILFSGYENGSGEIYLINSDGSGLANLTNNPAEDVSPQWIER